MGWCTLLITMLIGSNVCLNILLAIVGDVYNELSTTREERWLRKITDMMARSALAELRANPCYRILITMITHDDNRVNIPAITI